ncbi:DUF6660 family protein [Xanthocytophaga flavus]|uniref:DUF6660 family protein n=1 Tax=Xanthocytophaga flava TaxID=3048013 RepID=UPI00391EF62B
MKKTDLLIFFHLCNRVECFFLYFALLFKRLVMNRLLIILGLWIWALSCIPCRDLLPLSQNFDSGPMISIDTCCQADQGETLHVCSPLCTCNCCGLSLITPLQISFSISVPAKSSSRSFQDMIVRPVQVSSSFWQPPKLG